MADQYASINGERVIKGDVCIPYYGLWVADIEMAESIKITTAVELSVGNLTLKGHIFRSASFSGSKTARIVGGTGGLRKNIPSQGYYKNSGVKKSTILRDACAAVSEQVSITTDSTLGTYYTREAGTAERVFRQVLGEIWWVDPATGILQAQDRTQVSPITSQFDVIMWSGAKGRFQIATEDIAAWLPARTFQNTTVTVQQSISLTNILIDNSGKVRLEVLSTGYSDAS